MQESGSSWSAAEIGSSRRARHEETDIHDQNTSPTQVVGSQTEDTFDHRMLCGTGDFDVPAFIAVGLRLTPLPTCTPGWQTSPDTPAV